MARPVAPDEAKGGLFGFWFFQSKNLPNMKKAATNTEPHADAEKEWKSAKGKQISEILPGRFL